MNKQATIYPEDASAANPRMDVIDPVEVKTIPGLFRERVRRSSDKIAYSQFDSAREEWVGYSWREMSDDVEVWQRAIAADGFAQGKCAAIRMGNRREWVLYDQACMAAGLVVTPLYSDDRPDNIAYILAHTGARLLLLENAAMWLQMKDESSQLRELVRVVVLEDADHELDGIDDARVMLLARWLEQGAQSNTKQPAHNPSPAPSPAPPAPSPAQPDDLATIVYTSGTTGKPKGVMLSHANILMNAQAGVRSVAVFPDDQFLSFLPLSHMFERTVGYYLAMMAGAMVAFNRSIAQLPDDMAAIRPTIMIAVPRIFERAHNAINEKVEHAPALSRWLFKRAVAVGWHHFEISQGRATWNTAQLLLPVLNKLVAKKIRMRFGGNLRCVISGGAPLAANVSRTFIALGIEILQGYGLTETGPTLTVNTLKKNQPSSIGLPFIGAEIRLSDSGELQARSPSVMLGYWKNEQATRACIDSEGWFASGDLASIDAHGFISITGRLKDIIVLATGEKVPPTDMESAICDDSLFEQAMVVGEGRAFLCALIVLNPQSWSRHAEQLGVNETDQAALAESRVEEFMLDKIAQCLRDFPGYAAVRRVWVTNEPWSVTDGTLTPTLKIKRPVLRERFKTQIQNLYETRR